MHIYYIYWSRTQQRYQYKSYLPYAINYKVDRIIYDIANDTIFKPTSNDKKIGRTFDEMIRKLLQKVCFTPKIIRTVYELF